MKQEFIRPKFVEFIPEQLEDGVLYVSEKYKTATHRCCCGCGEEVVTPLGQTGWTLRKMNGEITLSPSIGNWSFKCESHYWIRKGKVVWAGQMSQHHINENRIRDAKMRDAYFLESNRKKKVDGQLPSDSKRVNHVEKTLGKNESIMDMFKNWLRGL